MLDLIIALVALVVFGGVLIYGFVLVIKVGKKVKLRKAWIDNIMEWESWLSYSEFLKYHDRKAWLKYVAENKESK